MILTRRSFGLTAGALSLSGCGVDTVISDSPEPLGDFSLGYNIVVVDQPGQGPFSRDATDAELKAALEQGIANHFGRFKGTGTYHIAVKLQQYVLAQTGIPVVATPKSIFVVTANVWNLYGRLNAETELLEVFEGVSGSTIVGSGATQTKEEQMARLSANTAGAIEAWLRKHPEWFTPEATAAAAAAATKATHAEANSVN